MRAFPPTRYAVIIVTYYPDEGCLAGIRRMAATGGRVIIVDNTPLPDAPGFPAAENITCFRYNRNAGLSAALNKGFDLAARENIADVFLLDQDSRPCKHGILRSGFC